MANKDDCTGTPTTQNNESKSGDQRYHPSPNAWVSVQSRDGCLHFDAGVKQSEVERIAALAQIPEDQIEPLAARLRAILLSHAMSVSNRDKSTRRHFTRHQLLDAISKLTQQDECNKPPAIPPWLVGELIGIEAQRIMEAKLGRQTRLDFSTDELRQMLPVRAQAFEHAQRRVEASRNDSDALRELAFDAQRAISARSETTEEWLATKRALKPERSLVADGVVAIWIDQLARPHEVTKTLTALADAVYRLCGLKMSVDAVKWQLRESMKQRSGET